MADSRTENEINEPVIGTGWQAVKWEHLFPGDNGKNKRDHGMKLYESGHVMFVTETKKASGSLIEGTVHRVKDSNADSGVIFQFL